MVLERTLAMKRAACGSRPGKKPLVSAESIHFSKQPNAGSEKLGPLHSFCNMLIYPTPYCQIGKGKRAPDANNLEVVIRGVRITATRLPPSLDYWRENSVQWVSFSLPKRAALLCSQAPSLSHWTHQQKLDWAWKTFFTFSNIGGCRLSYRKCRKILTRL